MILYKMNKYLIAFFLVGWLVRVRLILLLILILKLIIIINIILILIIIMYFNKYLIKGRKNNIKIYYINIILIKLNIWGQIIILMKIY